MNKKTLLKVSHIEESTNLLGPFNRFVLWLHGCCFNCDGCLAYNIKSGPYKEIEIEELCQKIINSNCEGITLSGGEPFLQAKELSFLIKSIKIKRNIGVIVYSGYTLKEIQCDSKLSPLLSDIDILIDGRYEKEHDDGRAYVGSSNQVIHYLTKRYINVGEDYYLRGTRRAEIKLTPTQAMLIGVPSKEMLTIWQNVKEKCGGMCDDF